MVLTRAQNQPGPDGVLGTDDDIQNANNTDTPWVDQSQTYTSHASHQVFLREYAADAPSAQRDAGRDRQAARRCLATGRDLRQAHAGTAPTEHLDLGRGQEAGRREARSAAAGQGRHQHPDAGRPTRTASSSRARTGCRSTSPRTDARHWLSRATSPTRSRCRPTSLHFDTPFLTDIAHNADPSPQDTDNDPATPPVAPDPDADNTPSADFAHQPAGTYDDEMLNAHFACGDGRCNENIALITIHQIFHSEHDRLVDDIEHTLEPADTQPRQRRLPRGIAECADRPAPTLRLRRAAVPGRPLRDRDGVPAPGVRGVRPQGAAGGPAVPRLLAGHQPGDPRRVRARRLPLRPLDARRRRRPHERGRNGAKTTTRCRCSTAFLNPPEYFNGGTAGTSARPSRPPAASSWAPPTRSATSSTSSSPRPCATTCSACRSTCRRSTWPGPVRPASRR